MLFLYHSFVCLFLDWLPSVNPLDKLVTLWYVRQPSTNWVTPGLFLYYSKPISFLLSSWYHSHLSPFRLCSIKHLFFLLPLQFFPLHKFFPIRKKLSLISLTRRKTNEVSSLLSLPSSSYFLFFFSQQNISVNILCLYFAISYSFFPSFLVIPLAKLVGLFSVLHWWTSICHIKWLISPFFTFCSFAYVLPYAEILSKD